MKKEGQIDRKMKPKAAPRRPNNPTSCRQNPDTKPGTARDAKKTRKRSQNGGKMKQKGNPMGAQIRRNCFKNGAIRLQGYAKPREDAASRGNTAQDAAQSREKPHRDAGRRRETWKYAAGSRTETREDAERHRKTPKDAERGRETRKDARCSPRSLPPPSPLAAAAAAAARRSRRCRRRRGSRRRKTPTDAERR